MGLGVDAGDLDPDPLPRMLRQSLRDLVQLTPPLDAHHRIDDVHERVRLVGELPEPPDAWRSTGEHVAPEFHVPPGASPRRATHAARRCFAETALECVDGEVSAWSPYPERSNSAIGDSFVVL